MLYPDRDHSMASWRIEAAGRMTMTPPARADLETFRASVKRRELELSGSVGQGGRNGMRGRRAAFGEAAD